MADGRSRFLGSWRLLGADTLLVGWTDGYSTFGLHLGMHSDTLRGTGELGSDLVIYSESPPRMRFVAARIPCDSATNGRSSRGHR